ncbi:MAG: porin, partial [Proteobacteria bacterium]|nr:porin [Pseudomonadota bacterium]
ASWAKTEMTVSDLDRKTFTLGYDYYLSKRTDVYAMYMNDRITSQTTGNSFGVGVRHRF